MYRELIIILVFLAGFLFCLNLKNKDVKEGFKINIANDCPNLLLQKENHFLLFNTNKASIPGVNPIRFRNLEDNGEVNYTIYSGHPTDKELSTTDGKTIATHEIMMNSLEAGTTAYINRRSVYEAVED